MIPVLVPKLPETPELIPYLQQIDNSRIYSNFGPLHRQFASGLGALTNASGVALTSNGTTAIELALRALDLPRDGSCFMPAYTFIASAHAVANAGLIPHFLDVDERSLALTPEIVKRALDGASTKPAAVLVVSAYGAPMDVENWNRFSEAYDMPVVFDGAAAVTSITDVGKNPICVSLHATKTLGIGEGGAVLSSDAKICDRITAMTGFGFTGTERVSQFLGGNYRISEYAAAIGLASLDMLPARVQRLKGVAVSYRSALGDKRTRMQENIGEGWISTTLNVRIPADAVEQTTRRLDSSAIAWRRWWGYGCHTHPAFVSYSHEELSITNVIAYEIIGLPFYEDITETEIQQVVDCLV